MDTRGINIVTLAYLGDAIYEVYIRKFLVEKGIAKVDELQRESIRYVSAKSQCKILNYLTSFNYLNEEELDIVKRGRNYKRESHPKNTDIMTYKMSTGFEAMIGYLFLENKIDRLNEIIDYILGGNYEENY